MTSAPSDPLSRRDFLADTGRFTAASALAGVALPNVHGGSDETIQVALVGCGGRGTGAAGNALAVPNGNLKLVAATDVFDKKPHNSVGHLKDRFKDQVDVRERTFVGFDGYRKAMDCLRPGDIVILTTPPAFRWVHYQYAIEKGLNVFMEKPVTTDGPTSKRMFALNEQAKAKGLKVAVGLMSRHNYGMQELKQRIDDGEIGEITFMRGYRMHGPAAFFRSKPKPDGISHLMYQIQRFHSFLWASGGNFSDFNIHIVDHLCWMKGAWPIKAHAVGGRHYREDEDGTYVDQNFDSYAVEYTFEDGAKLFFEGRYINGCHNIYKSNAHGTKGMAIVSASNDCGLPSATFRNQKGGRDAMIWRSRIAREKRNPYQNEWDTFIAAIRAGEAYNEVDTGINTSLVTSMGRMAAHTGQEVTYDAILNGDHEFAPDVDKLTLDSDAPLMPEANGLYPVPMPGKKGMREY